MRNILSIVPAAFVAIAGTAAQAQTASNIFSIQGYLEDAGAPAQGNYDIEVEFFSTPGGATGLIVGDLFFSPISVSDGLFSIEVMPQFQIGAAAWAQITTLPDVYVQFAFRPSGSGEAFVPMLTRPRLASTPRASMAYDIPASLKPWTVTGNTAFLGAPASNVGIGVATALSPLHVNGDIRTNRDILAGRNASVASNVLVGDSIFFRSGTPQQWRIQTSLDGTVTFAGPGGDVFRIDVDGSSFKGNLRIDGELEVQDAITIHGADIAEPFDVNSESAPLPGHVVVIDPANPGDLRLASGAYDTRVAGVISGAGGIRAGMHLRQPGTIADGEFPVAMNGRVYVYVDADEGGAVEPGDLLTTATRLGHAMKAGDDTRSHGAVIGKAMTRLEKGQGLVLVLVNLQ